MNAPSRKPLRIRGFDYSSPGAYFVTICVKERRNIFWSHIPSAVGAAISRPPLLTADGHLVLQAIQNISTHYPSVTVDKFCIMPDHIHMIVQIHADEHGRQVAAPTVSVVIGHMKRYVSKQLGYSPWQRSYLDRIIRNEKSYQAVWEYIDNNPRKLDYGDTPLDLAAW